MRRYDLFVGQDVKLKKTRADDYGLPEGPYTITEIKKHFKYKRWWIKVKQTEGLFKHTDFEILK